MNLIRSSSTASKSEKSQARLGLGAALLVMGCLGLFSPPEAPANPENASDPIAEAVAHPARPAADVKRDADRKPDAVLRFAGIEPGQRVADLMTGKGYYADLISHVTADNDAGETDPIGFCYFVKLAAGDDEAGK